MWGIYGGDALSDNHELAAAATSRDHTDGAILATGQRFQISVNTYDADASTTGYHLVWNQVPCGGLVYH